MKQNERKKQTNNTPKIKQNEALSFSYIVFLKDFYIAFKALVETSFKVSVYSVQSKTWRLFI